MEKLWVVNFITACDPIKTYGFFQTPQQALKWMKEDINRYIENLKQIHSPEWVEKCNLNPVTPDDFSAYLEYYNENPCWYITEIQKI